MPIGMFDIEPGDIELAASLLILQSGDTEAINRARRRAHECRKLRRKVPASLWDQVTAKLCHVIPADMHPENIDSQNNQIALAA